MTVARVLTDVAGIPKEFDYLVPEALASRVSVGTMVRVPLGGRRVGGWVVGLSSEASTDRPLRPLAKVTGFGPPRRPGRAGRLGGVALGGPAVGVPEDGVAASGRRRAAAAGER